MAPESRPGEPPEQPQAQQERVSGLCSQRAACSPRGSCGPGRGRGSWPQRHLLQRAFDKEPFPPWVTRALLASGTFSAELFRGGARPWSARARARGPGLGAALAPQARAGDHPGTRASPLFRPLPRRDAAAAQVAGGLCRLERVCVRAPPPHQPRLRPARPSPARARRAPGASSCFRRESTLSRLSLHPASAPAPRATSKHVQRHSRAGKEQLESLPSPKSALPRPSRTPKRQQHLPTTFHAQAVRSPPEHAKSGLRPASLVPSGWAHAPTPAPRLAGVGRTRGAAVPIEPHGPRARLPRMVWPLSRSAQS